MNERNKKIYAWIVAVLLFLSVATSFLPSVQVKASDEPISFEITSLDFISSGRFTGIDSGFNYTLYETGYNNAINGNRFPLDALENVVSAERNPFPCDFDSVYTSLVSNFENYNYSVTFNDFGSGNTYNDLKSFITDPSLFNYYVCIGNSSTSSSPAISIFYSHGDLKLCQVNKTVYAYSTDTIYNMNFPFNRDYMADYRDIYTYSANTLNNVSSTFYNVYSTFPIFLTYQNNGVTGDNDYSSYSSASTLANDYLVNGVNSDFFIDRRLLFSNFVPDTPNYNVDDDPISQEYYGAWDIDLVPVGDVLNGSIKVKFVPSSRLSEYNSDLQIHYSFQLFFTGSKIGTGLVMTPRVKTWLVNNGFGSKTSGFSYNINSSFCSNTGAIMDNLTNEYTTFSTSNILSNIGDTGSNVSLSNGRNQNINSYYQLKLYRDFEYFSGTTLSGSGSVSYGNVTTGISSQNGGVSTCKLTVYAQAFYNGEEFTDIAVATYDYLTGDVIKQGTASTNNNTPTTDGVPDGISQGYQEQIQNTIDRINSDGGVQNITGGQISGGNNSNSNNNNPTFTNNNNPSITINNNNGLTEPDGVPENPEEGSFSMLWSIWESYHFAEWLNQDLEGNGFLHYIFSSEIWNLPIFNLIIPALAILITVSIASTIIRFIRGN